MSLNHIADGSGPQVLTDSAIPILAVALVPHHRGDLMLAGSLRKQPCFPDIVAQWFFAEHVLSKFNRPERSRRVVMVGGRYEHGINVFVHRVEHLTIVKESSGFCSAFSGLPGGRFKTCILYVDNRHQVFTESSGQAGFASSTAPDHGGR
jgi:hypothetical protein